MSHTFYLNERRPGFLGVAVDKPSPDVCVLGVPFDSGVSWRPGTRLGPQAIRDASLNIETYSYRYRFDSEKLRIDDLGDLAVIHGDTPSTLGILERTIMDTTLFGVPIFMMGGEHTMTLAAVKALKPDLFIVFDAHTDMRDEYLGFKLSHATISRRVSEVIGPERVLQVGVRASCYDEIKYINDKGIKTISSLDILTNGMGFAYSTITELVRSSKRVYVSVDLDVLDPSCMPGVGNPEAEGISVHTLIELLDKAVDKNLVGFDVMELNPSYDPSGISSITAAKIILEGIVKHIVAKQK
ncbi:MAG TPA: agmatinase [bacterium]|nr:agmatinase [bacterium]